MKGTESNELLPIGTRVTVGNRRGIVIKAEIVPASNFGTVALHTIKFNQKIKILTMNRREWIDTPEKIENINYAAIYYQDL